VRRPRILIVDDDPGVLKFVRASLQAMDFQTLTAMDGAEALDIIERELPDLIILDILMPKMDGFEVCRQVREWSRIPIIMLSARGDVEDKVKGLDLGADDYIAKPFGVNELTARVRVILRRTGSVGAIPTQPSFTSGNFTINFVERRVTVAGKEVKLTPTEYNLLQELALNVGKVLTHSHLLGKVWGPEYAGERGYLTTFIARLRTKLEADPKNPEYIINVPGVGYKFKDTAYPKVQ